MENIRWPLWLKVLVVSLLLLDLSYSFQQLYHKSIGGDIAQILVPTPKKGYYKVLQDPLGFSVLFKKQRYSNPNRFFAHWTTSKYLNNIPLFLQNFVDPIDSVYLAIALAKFLMHILLLFGMTYMITGKWSGNYFHFILLAFILSPLMQINGYHRFMGLIDDSIIYAFFYALPISLLFFLLFPFTRFWFHKIYPQKNYLYIFLLYALSVYLSLNGPLIPGIILIILFLCGIYFVYSLSLKELTPGKIFQHLGSIFPGYLLGLALWMGFWSLYSLYLGSFNTLNEVDPVSIIDRYKKLPAGLWELMTTKIAFLMLFVLITVFLFLVHKRIQISLQQKIHKIVLSLFGFCFFYILLLPLGGFREYRPGIVRYDTFIPVSIAIMIIFGFLLNILLQYADKKTRNLLIPLLLVYFFVFTNADGINENEYRCEREKLEKIASSPERIVRLDSDCPLLEFRLISKPEDTRLKSALLLHWHIIDEEKTYFQQLSEE